MTHREIHLMHAAGQFSDSPDEVRSDYRAAFTRRPDAVGFTECSAGSKARTILRNVAHQFDYEVHGGPGDTAVATRHRVLASGSIFVNAGTALPPALGGHGPRYIDWTTFRWQGEVVTYHEAHWLTRSGTGLHRRQHAKMSRLMVEAVQEHGEGWHLAFFGGDINIDERTDLGADPMKPHAIFTDGHLTTIFDELNTYPVTAGRKCIDIIGSYDPDTRVSASRIEVWPLGNSDHHAVSGYYDVALR